MLPTKLHNFITALNNFLSFPLVKFHLKKFKFRYIYEKKIGNLLERQNKYLLHTIHWYRVIVMIVLENKKKLLK